MPSLAAVIEAPATTPKTPRPRIQPPYAVIVLNDNVHTAMYVIDTFVKVLGYDRVKCYKLAEEIEAEGRAIVWSGSLEVAELKRDQLMSAGPDFFAPRVVKTPLGVILEPVG